jgi:hypothetical protein
VDPPGGNAIAPPGKGATHWQDHIWFPTSPLKALRAKLPNAKIEFNSGQDLAAAAALAKSEIVDSEALSYLNNRSCPRPQGGIAASNSAAKSWLVGH